MSPIPETVLPTSSQLDKARSSLVKTLPREGLGEQTALDHIRNDICPALNNSSKSPNYYGFVTGGTTPAAAFADNLVTEFDQNAQVHLPNETITTDVEDRALSLLCELLDLEPADWKHKIFTTGATASNILGLACGRQYIIEEAARRNDSNCILFKASVAQSGLMQAMRYAEVDDIRILTTVPHSSLAKAASILGLGRDAVKLFGRKDKSHKFDMTLLEYELSKHKIASIVAISCGDVNTGFYATTGAEMSKIRKLCNQYGAWLHVDGAFGLMARILNSDPSSSTSILDGVANIELADSITGDGHKLLNVPYDCGFFFSRHPGIGLEVFQNQGAAYLCTSPVDDNAIISPLNIGLENSRRFRALPVYANLLIYGEEGYRKMLWEQMELAQRIAEFISNHEGYEVLPKGNHPDNVFIVVLFKAKDETLNDVLVTRINETSKIYVSGTVWDGEKACRFAVSNWQADAEKDIKIIGDVLERVHADFLVNSLRGS
ncbi:PLP-dependent transferase [Tothia fuscella]|uniref:PLP-dependent transferase n=1 Tax=Tothia fuscella TaxID=1048955 RepID=A0A9P4NY08_9PEZI|nr:PLP-dependent transferase [Tothia fuscella]